MLPPSRVPSFCPTAKQFVLITTNSPSLPAESFGRKESVPCLVIDLKSQVVGGIQTGRYRQNPALNRPNSQKRHIRPKPFIRPLQSKPAGELWRDQSHTMRMEFRRTSPIPAIDTPLQLAPSLAQRPDTNRFPHCDETFKRCEAGIRLDESACFRMQYALPNARRVDCKLRNLHTLRGFLPSHNEHVRQIPV